MAPLGIGEVHGEVRPADKLALVATTSWRWRWRAPMNPKLIGQNMVVLPDANGKLFRKEIIDGAQKNGKRWVDERYV